MFYVLALGLLGACAAGGHMLVARLLGVRGMTFASQTLRAEAFSASRARRLAVRGAEPLAAYVALVLLNVLLYANERVPTSQVRVAPGLPAEQAGLRDGDRILSVREVPVTSFDQLRERIQQAGGESLPLQVERGAEVLSLVVTPDAQGRIGVFPTEERLATPLHLTVLNAVGAPLKALAYELGVVIRLAVGQQEHAVLMAPVAIFNGERPSRLLVYLVVLVRAGGLVWPVLLIQALFTAWMGERQRLRVEPQAAVPGA
jgi:membrane-associated protease RseP (regulator of RpoE activity)